MDKRDLQITAANYGFVKKGYVAPKIDYTGSIDSSRCAGPMDIIQLYQNAMDEGASWDDCNQSALYYYGLPLAALLAACGAWLAFH